MFSVRLLTSHERTDYLCFGFDQDGACRFIEMISGKQKMGNFHVVIYSEGVVGFAEYREHVTNGLG